MSNKFYIVSELTLDCLQEFFRHNPVKPVEYNKINKGKVEALELLKNQVISVESDELKNKITDFFPSEIFVSIDCSSERCKVLFNFFNKEGYSGNFDKLLEEAVFKVDLEEKTVKSYAHTKEPAYSIELFQEIHKNFVI